MKNARFLPLKLSVQLKVHGHISEEINSYPEFTFFPIWYRANVKGKNFHTEIKFFHSGENSSSSKNYSVKVIFLITLAA